MSNSTVYDLAGKFQEAFEYFNSELFQNLLPQVIITTQRHRGASGFFSPESYMQRKFDKDGVMLCPEFKVHEIAIMPDCMYDRPDREVLSTPDGLRGHPRRKLTQPQHKGSASAKATAGQDGKTKGTE